MRFEWSIMRNLPIAAIVLGLAASVVWAVFLGYQFFRNGIFVLIGDYSTSVLPASSRLERKKPKAAPISIPRATPETNTAYPPNVRFRFYSKINCHSGVTPAIQQKNNCGHQGRIAAIGESYNESSIRRVCLFVWSQRIFPRS